MNENQNTETSTLETIGTVADIAIVTASAVCAAYQLVQMSKKVGARVQARRAKKADQN